MSTLRRVAVRTIPAVLLTAAVALAPARTAPAGPPAVQLVETVPVETRLGDPALPSTAGVWVAMIDGARESLEFEHFYLSHWPGEPSGPVLDAIGRAAARGVRVRILLDVRFRATYPEPADSLAGLANVEVRWIDMKRLSGGGVQHAKWMVVDGQELFVGSQNLDWRALKHIHELGARVRDPRTAGLFQRVFEHDWRAADPEGEGTSAAGLMRLTPRELVQFPARLAQAPGDTVEVWPSFSPIGHLPDSSLWDLDAMVRLLDGARHEVVAQMLSYGIGREGGRDTTLDAALRRAARRGVRVRLLVSDWQADGARMGDLQRLTEVAGVEARLSSIPEWSGGYIPFARVDHSKFMVVDTLWTWIGTSNWEPSYFRASRNAALTLRNRPIARQARGVFESGWRAPSSREVRMGETYPPRVHRETPPPGARLYGG